MRWHLVLACVGVLSVLAGAQGIDTTQVGLFAYMNVGGNINLATLNAVAQAQNSSGLFPTAEAVVQTTNFTESNVWWVSGDIGSGSFCVGLPYLFEDGMSASERTTPCTNRWGFAGSVYDHASLVGVSGCSVSGCGVFKVRVRIRNDGNIMAYVFRSSLSGPAGRAALSHWNGGGKESVPAIVDDTVLGVTLQRVLQVIAGANANASGLSTYLPSLVSYYDFEYSNATTILVGGRGIGNGGYAPVGSTAFIFTANNRSIQQISGSWKVTSDASACLRVNGANAACRDSSNGGCTVSSAALSSNYRLLANASTTTAVTIPACASANSPAGSPFVSFILGTLSSFGVTSTSSNNVSSTVSDELKVAFWLLLGN